MSQENPEASMPQTESKAQRLGFVDNLAATARHVSSSVNSHGGQIRKEDYWSILLVPMTSIGLLVAVLSAGWARMAVSTLALAALLYYILARIGVMRGLTERQAVLVWHIIMATFLMGITFAFVYLEAVNHFR